MNKFKISLGAWFSAMLRPVLMDALKDVLMDALQPLRQDIADMRGDVNALQSLWQDIANLQQNMDSKFDLFGHNLTKNIELFREEMHSGLGHLCNGTVVEQAKYERGVGYAQRFEAYSFVQLARIVFDMPAFEGRYNILTTFDAITAAVTPLMALVDEFLVAALEGDERFPESLTQAVQDQMFDQIANGLTTILQRQDLSECERATLKRMQAYYSASTHDERFVCLARSELGIQALRFKLAPNKKPLETERSLESDMQGVIRMFGDVFVIEAAQIEFSYSFEAAEQVALRAHVMGWCVRNLGLADAATISQEGVLWIRRRTETNKELASGRSISAPRINGIAVSVHYV